MTSTREFIENSILTHIYNHGIDVVAEAATRTLPVISFAESNKGIGKYKDMAEDALASLNKAKKELEDMNKLVTNLEGEVRRQADEIRKLENTTANVKNLADKIAGHDGVRMDDTNPHKIVVECDGDLLGEAVLLYQSGGEDMVLATFHDDDGDSRQEYIPLQQFLLFYKRN